VGDGDRASVRRPGRPRPEEGTLGQLVDGPPIGGRHGDNLGRSDPAEEQQPCPIRRPHRRGVRFRASDEGPAGARCRVVQDQVASCGVRDIAVRGEPERVREGSRRPHDRHEDRSQEQGHEDERHDGPQ
jgi:hypothetical protein